MSEASFPEDMKFKSVDSNGIQFPRGASWSGDPAGADLSADYWPAPDEMPDPLFTLTPS